MKSPANILVARIDRIGDLLLSTPVFSAIRSSIPGARITALVAEPNVGILERNPCIDDVLRFNPARHLGIAGARVLSRGLAAKEFDVSVSLQTSFSLELALYLSGIPIRIGPTTAARSILFYNRPVFDNRSRVERHEAEYNLDLLSKLGVTAAQPRRTYFYLGDEETQEAKQLIASLDLRGAAVVAFHPGMGGSAKNWSVDRYARLAGILVQSGLKLLLTGLESERPILERIKQSGGDDSVILTDLTVRQLAAVYKESSVFFGPSTGPMHLANSVGVPVVALFSPIRVQSAKRWGPYCPGAEVIVPGVKCPRKYRCTTSCRYYDCFDSIEPEYVAARIASAARK